MEDGVNHSPEQQEKIQISETLDRQCEYYMSIGLPCDEFWNGDYTYFKHYQGANEIRLAQQNQMLYMQGLYNYKAYTAALAGAFGGSGDAARYFTEPIPITDIEREEQKRRSVKRTKEFFEKGQGNG